MKSDPFADGRARLRAARKARGYTLAEAAELTGLDLTTINRYECRGNIPSAVDLGRLCDAYGVSADEILGRAPSVEHVVDGMRAVAGDARALAAHLLDVIDRAEGTRTAVRAALAALLYRDRYRERLEAIVRALSPRLYRVLMERGAEAALDAARGDDE